MPFDFIDSVPDLPPGCYWTYEGQGLHFWDGDDMGPRPRMDCDCVLMGTCNWGEPDPPPYMEFMGVEPSAANLYDINGKYRKPKALWNGWGDTGWNYHWSKWYNPFAKGGALSDTQGMPFDKRSLVTSRLGRDDDGAVSSDSRVLKPPLPDTAADARLFVGAGTVLQPDTGPVLALLLSCLAFINR